MTTDATLCSLVGTGAELDRSFFELISFGPRFTGSVSEGLARAYLADRFTALGLGVDLQDVPVKTYVRGDTHARVLSADRELLLQAQAFAYAPSTGEPLVLDLVHGQAGDPCDMERLKDSIPGKAVYCRPSDEMRSRRHKNLTECGAAAGVFGSHVAHHDACIISYVRETSVPSVPAIGLNRSSTAELESMLASGPARIEIDLCGSTVDAVSANLIATLNGRSSLPQIVVGGHLDTYDLCEGALDNSAGAAVILETARVMAALPKPLRTVKFVLFTAEEVSCLGSKKFVSERLSDPTDCGLFLNVDMPVEGGFPGLLKSPGAGEDGYWNSLAGELRCALPLQSLTSRDSDHGPFVEKGVPAVWVRSFRPGERGPAAIEHTVLDTSDKVSRAELFESALLTARILHKLAESEELPFDPKGAGHRAA